MCMHECSCVCLHEHHRGNEFFDLVKAGHRCRCPVDAGGHDLPRHQQHQCQSRVRHRAGSGPGRNSGFMSLPRMPSGILALRVATCAGPVHAGRACLTDRTTTALESAAAGRPVWRKGAGDGRGAAAAGRRLQRIHKHTQPPAVCPRCGTGGSVVTSRLSPPACARRASLSCSLRPNSCTHHDQPAACMRRVSWPQLNVAAGSPFLLAAAFMLAALGCGISVGTGAAGERPLLHPLLADDGTPEVERVCQPPPADCRML